MKANPESRGPAAADLIALRLPEEPALAPDGQRAVLTLGEIDLARSEERRQLQLVLPPTAGEELGEGSTISYGLEDAREPEYSPDGTQLAFVTFRAQPHEDEEDDEREDGHAKSQVFVMPTGGGEARRLSELAEGVESYRWLPDGSGVLALGQAPRPAAERAWRRHRGEQRDDPSVADAEIPAWEIWRIPLEGRAERLLAGERGLEDFDVSPDGRLLAYASNHTGRPEDVDRVEIVVLELETGESWRVSSGRGGAESGPRFTLDGRHLVYGGWADPKISFSRQELFAVEIESRSAPRPLLASFDRDLEEYVALPDGRVAVLVAWGLESRVLFIDPATGRCEALPLEGWVLRSMSAADVSGDLAFIAENAARAPELAVWRAGGSELEFWTELNPDTRTWARAERRRVVWDNEGFRHEGLLLLPPGVATPPVLVWLHGGPHWRPLDTLRCYEAEAYVADGFAVFLPQYRGSSGESERYALAIRRDLGGAEARDIVAGLDRIVADGLVDGARAAVAGASYGGYLTSWLLATTDRFRAGISMAGIFDLGHDYLGSDHFIWEEHYLGARPWEEPELYHQRSPLAHVETLRAPVLVLHGVDDDITPLANSRGLYRALRALGRDTELVVYPREGHGLTEPQHRLDAHARITEWLARHVGGAERPHVAGRSLTHEAVTLLPLEQHVRRDYAGRRPPEGRVYFEVSLLLSAAEGGPELLALQAAGGSADIVLIDGEGGLHRPIGVPIEVHGQTALLAGRGTVEAWVGEDGRPPSLAVSSVFELPEEHAVYELRVLDFPPLRLAVRAEPEHDDSGPFTER